MIARNGMEQWCRLLNDLWVKLYPVECLKWSADSGFNERPVPVFIRANRFGCGPMNSHGVIVDTFYKGPTQPNYTSRPWQASLGSHETVLQ